MATIEITHDDSEPMTHIPADEAHGLRGPALCGVPAGYSTGDHDLIRRLASTELARLRRITARRRSPIIDPPASTHYCPACMRRYDFLHQDAQ